MQSCMTLPDLCLLKSFYEHDLIIFLLKSIYDHDWIIFFVESNQ